MESPSIVHEGWLTKSPPEKRIWKTKWRRRWFVLKLSGQIPGQYVLEYYADATRRKLKGSIDLDQCEQVDAGLQLESCRKENFQHMFDVRTSKRTYYLVSKTEIEMNKWVECICSVCGLKIHVEEDRYSPQPQPTQEFAFSSTNSNNSSCGSNTATITTSQPHIPETTNNTLMSSVSFARISVTNQIDGPSGPYIPISECHTGKPINGTVIDMNSVPIVPTKASAISRTVSDECYDVPRQLNPSTDSTELSDDILSQVPKVSVSANTFQRNSADSALTNPPKVNWSTYPRDSPDIFSCNDGTRNSVRSFNASVDVNARHCSVNDSGIDTQRSSSPLSSEFSRDSALSNESNVHQPPPRPPKPPSLRKSKNKSESCASLPNVSSPFYDIPVSSSDHNSRTDEENSPTYKIPFASGSDAASPKSPDDLYDFPRMSSDSTSVTDIDKELPLLNATVPVAFDRKSVKNNSKKHSYTNAPPGYFVNKETVFNYEYRPTLPSSVDDHYDTLSNKNNSSDLETCQQDRSPLTPDSSSYNNLPISSSLPNSLSVAPPVVNRDLKPRRKGSDSDTSHATLPSPTTKTATIQLQPPPALTRIHSAPTKRSFRKPRQSQSSHNGTPPRIPSRLQQNQHNREPSTSEDDISIGGNGSRRNSANEEQYSPVRATVVPPPRRPFDTSEIQYLDLDLDSDTNSQSPRTPNEYNHQRSNSTLSNKDLSTNVTVTQPTVSGSTVYKTVDFLKTEAFNKMRLNVETYRNSQ